METLSRSPSISVVIPAYCREQLIVPTLKSVLGQTLSPMEVIVVDDLSPDGTVNAVRKFAEENPSLNLRCLVQDRNRGVSAARNRGIHEAAGEWVAFLDSDDLWESNHLELLAKKIDTEGAEVVFSRPARFSDGAPGKVEKNWASYCTCGEDVVKAMISVNYVLPSASMIKKTVLLSAGLFDEEPQIQHSEDLDLCLRLVEQGRRFALVDEYTCLYRQHPNSACKHKVKLYRAGMYCYRKNRHNTKYSWLRKNISQSYYQAKLGRALYEAELQGATREMFSAWIKQPLQFSRGLSTLFLILAKMLPVLRPFVQRFLNRYV